MLNNLFELPTHCLWTSMSMTNVSEIKLLQICLILTLLQSILLIYAAIHSWPKVRPDGNNQHWYQYRKNLLPFISFILCVAALFAETTDPKFLVVLISIGIFCLIMFFRQKLTGSGYTGLN